MPNVPNYVAQGQQTFSQAYAAAAQASPTGTPNFQGLAAAGVAVAEELGGDAVAQVVSDVMGAESAAASGALIASMISAEAGPLGAAIGLVIAAIASVPKAGANNLDSRPPTIQMLDNFFDPLAISAKNDPQVALEYAMFSKYLDAEQSVGTQFGGTTQTQDTANQAWNAFVATYPASGAQHAQEALARYRRWATLPAGSAIPSGSFLSLIAQPINLASLAGPYFSVAPTLAEAAVIGWDDATIYSYLLGMKKFIFENNAINGDVTDTTTLDGAIGILASLLKPAVPSRFAQWVNYYNGRGPAPL